MQSVIIDGHTIQRGDSVSFKSDIEQSGKVINIERGAFHGVCLTLANENGFSGDYIGGDTITDVMASDCWVEG